MKRFKGTLILIVFLFLVWVLLSGPGQQELISGAVISIFISLIVIRRSNPLKDIRLNPKSFLYALIYLAVFMVELVKSNLDVAFRVLNPSLPINPGIIKVRTKLKSKLGRLILANSITLTPGTLTVETRDEFFYIHWIDVSSDNIGEATERIVSRFEKYLEVIFG